MARARYLSLSPAHATPAESPGAAPLLAFAGCNYLGLSFHPAIRAALLQGLDRFGLSASASRETTGNVDIYEELEASLAGHIGHQAAVLTPEGYTANMAAAEVLATICAAAVIDERSHRSVGHAMRAAGLPVSTFAHLDAADADRAVQAARRSCGGRPIALCTDGVFAADGSVAPVPALLERLGDEDVLLVDDCHGLGTLGPRGEGTLRHHGLLPTANRRGGRIVITTTLAKAMGCHGGAVIASTEFAQSLVRQSGLYRGTTPMPPPLAAAAGAALALLHQEPTILACLHRNVLRLHEVLDAVGVDAVRQPSPIAAFVTGSEEEMAATERMVRRQGILAPLIEYPGGPAPRYFRLSVSALHTAEHFDRLQKALSEGLGRVGRSGAGAG